jgi:NAD(P)-dependent dehydrogenase (short-subunit alcohol dehydrogenase family)
MHDKGLSPTTPLAIVTGGTRGIGRATARELAARGYNLLLVALDDPDSLESELTGQGVVARFLKVDLLSPESAAKTIVETAIFLFHRIDLLVNCAGVFNHKSVADVVDSDWERIFAINLKAPFFLAQQAFPHLELTRGNIINVSSTNANHPARKNQLYDSLKASLNNLTQGLALDFRESGVRVNAVMPGGVRTTLSADWLKEFLGRPPTEEDFKIPSLAEPEQIAKVIALLASEEMAWVNGATLVADGGYGLG